MEMATNHVDIAWLAIGLLLIVLEVFTLPGVGLLFTGLGAVTVSGLLVFGVLGIEALSLQIACFLLLTCVWALLLWKPLKYFKNQRSAGAYSNIEGQIATVKDAPLEAGKLGYVSWSGTTMKARLSSEAQTSTIAVGSEVEITSVSGNVAIVDLAKSQ